MSGAEVAVLIEALGMHWENQHRMQIDNSPSYGEEAFYGLLGTDESRREALIADIASRCVPNDPTEFTPKQAAAHSFEVAEAWVALADRRVAALAEVKS